MNGLAIVQEPTDAVFPQMPSNVMKYVKVDHTIPATEMAALLVGLTGKSAPAKRKLSAKELKRLQVEILIATHDTHLKWASSKWEL
jgi:two-component system chemotaxis response regulator CheB